MRHGADGHQPEAVRQVDVGGALEELRRIFLQRAHDLFLPGAEEAPAQAEVEELEGMATRRLRLEVTKLQELCLSPAGCGSSVSWPVPGSGCGLQKGRLNKPSAGRFNVQACAGFCQAAKILVRADDQRLDLLLHSASGKQKSKTAAGVTQWLTGWPKAD